MRKTKKKQNKQNKQNKQEIPLKNNYITELKQRIEECEKVIFELDNSPVWQIVLKDLEAQRKMLDDNWQEITDPLKLQKARELKFAVLHILNLKQKYTDELKDKKRELKQFQSLDKEIPKDYDLESNYEGGVENA